MRAASYRVGSKALVAGVDLMLPPGQLIAVIGPNGAGKSTLLRLLSGELAPTEGAVNLDGRAIASYTAAALARRRAVVSQSTALSFPFTAREVVLLGASVPGFAAAPEEMQRTARDCLRTVGLTGFEERLYTQLSGGERQRVQIARALLQLAVAEREQREPTILMLDEPTASLDLAHQGLVLAEARRQAHQGRAVLAILHDLNLAAAFADELVLMSQGRIAARGTAQDVLSRRAAVARLRLRSACQHDAQARHAVRAAAPKPRLTLLPLAPGAIEQLAHLAREILLRIRLVEQVDVRVEAPVVDDGVARIARGVEHRHIRPQLGQAVAQLASADATGQHHVGEEEIDARRIGGETQRIGRRAGLDDGVAELLEDLTRILAHPVVVLDDQDRLARSRR